MTEFGIFESILILLTIAISISLIFRRFQLPVVLGYLAVGMAFGPFGLGWIPDIESIRTVAEFGVVFLMFTIGLEFSLPQLLALRHAVFVLGGLQVLLTVVITALLGSAIGLTVIQSIVIGSIVAMSSTALVTKLLSDQLEIAAPHGTNAIGILLFQDLAVIPFLILIPSLSALENGSSQAIMHSMLWALIKAAFAIPLILSIGRWLLRPLFHLIATARVIELFTLTVLLVTLGSAWLTLKFGLSLALGAFLAGIMLGETEFRHQIEVEIRPFRDVLLGLFFISIGMLLNVFAWHNTFKWILILLLMLTVGKAIITSILSMIFGNDKITSIRTGLVLAQGGEFGFALLTLALMHNVIPADYGQVILSAIILSIAIGPLIIRWNRNISRILFPKTVTHDLIKIRQNVRYTIEHLRKPVIILGYGRVGQNIARILEKAEVDYLALDVDPMIVKTAQTAGDPVTYGDATHPLILRATKLGRAAAVIISFSNKRSVIKIIDMIRRDNEKIPIIVRCRDDSDFDELRQHGATEIVAEIFEESLILAYNLLSHINVPRERAAKILHSARGHHYELLRQVFPGTMSENSSNESQHASTLLKPFVIINDSFAVNKTLAQLKLEKLGARVVAISQGANPHVRPTPKLKIKAGDILVLYGNAEKLEHAERFLLTGEK